MSYVNLFLLLAGEAAATVSLEWSKWCGWWLSQVPSSLCPSLWKQQRSWPETTLCFSFASATAFVFLSRENLLHGNAQCADSLMPKTQPEQQAKVLQPARQIQTLNNKFVMLLGSFLVLNSHYSRQKIVFPHWECASGTMVVIKTLL